MSDKAISALKAYGEAVNEIARLTSAIKQHLHLCPGVSGKMITDEYDFRIGDDTHLSRAYTFEEGEFGGREYLSQEEQAEVLAECEHCRAANESVQLRKAAKKARAIAKGRITRLARQIAEARHD